MDIRKSSLSLFAPLLAILLGAGLFAYEGGILKNHNHSTAAGDGGQLSSPTIKGIVTVDSATINGSLTVGNGMVLTGAVTTTGTQTFGSTVTIQGNQFSVGASSFQVANGAVSIGTSTIGNPSQLLIEDNSFGGIIIETQDTATQADPIIVGEGRLSGGAASDGQTLLNLSGKGWNTVNYIRSSNIIFNASGTFSGSNAGGFITFNTRANGASLAGLPPERMRISDSGNVGIGITNPSSALTVLNGDIRISTTSGSRGIIFQDGSKQSSSGLMVNSSYTFLSAQIANSANVGPCVAGTTVTITTNGGLHNVLITFTGGDMEPGATNAYDLWALMDGQFIDSFTSSLSMWRFANGNVSGAGGSGAMFYMQLPPSAASHSWCFTFKASGGGTINCQNSGCQFGVREF